MLYFFLGVACVTLCQADTSNDAQWLAQAAQELASYELPSGVWFQVESKGKGELSPTELSRQELRYTAFDRNGEVVEDVASTLRQSSALSEAWQQIVFLMREQDEWVLYLPSSYGTPAGSNQDEPLKIELRMMDVANTNGKTAAEASELFFQETNLRYDSDDIQIVSEAQAEQPTVEPTAEPLSEEARISNQWLAEVGASSLVYQLPSGVLFQVLERGDHPNDVSPREQDYTKLSYTGKLRTGEVFESNSEVTVQPHGMIEGLNEALQLMRDGDHWLVYIPGTLAYGSRGTITVPPDAAVNFSVQVIDVIGAGKPASEASRQLFDLTGLNYDELGPTDEPTAVPTVEPTPVPVVPTKPTTPAPTLSQESGDETAGAGQVSTLSPPGSDLSVNTTEEGGPDLPVLPIVFGLIGCSVVILLVVVAVRVVRRSKRKDGDVADNEMTRLDHGENDIMDAVDFAVAEAKQSDGSAVVDTAQYDFNDAWAAPGGKKGLAKRVTIQTPPKSSPVPAPVTENEFDEAEEEASLPVDQSEKNAEAAEIEINLDTHNSLDGGEESGVDHREDFQADKSEHETPTQDPLGTRQSSSSAQQGKSREDLPQHDSQSSSGTVAARENEKPTKEKKSKKKRASEQQQSRDHHDTVSSNPDNSSNVNSDRQPSDGGYNLYQNTYFPEQQVNNPGMQHLAHMSQRSSHSDQDSNDEPEQHIADDDV